MSTDPDMATPAIIIIILTLGIYNPEGEKIEK